jgi:hypothetical protein
MKTLNLLEVPKDRPSKRELLHDFMARHKIETSHCKGLPREDYPWLACLMPRARQLGRCYGVSETASLMECYSKVGRLLDDAEVTTYGRTEREAVEALCVANKIAFELK